MTKRIHSANLIAKKYKDYLYRKTVREIIKKSKDYYSIIPFVQKCSNTPEIQIHFKKGKVSTFKLSYCLIRKMYLFDVSRRMVSQLKYKFCFVINGTPIIDPQYSHVYSNGEYLNVINIKEIQDKELLRELEYSNEIEKYYSSSSSNSLSSSETTSSSSSSSNNSEEDKLDTSPKYIEIGDYKALTPKVKKVMMYGIETQFSKETQTDGSVQLSSVKSILKDLKSFKMRNESSSSKHVSFGKVETSCERVLFL